MLTATSSALRSMARPGSAAIIDQGVASLGTFLTGVILARSLTPDNFGLYMLGWAVVLLVVELQTTVVTDPYIVYRPHLQGRDRARYLGSTIVEQLGVSGLMMFILAGVWIALRPTDAAGGIASVMAAMALTMGFILFRDFLRRILLAHLRPLAALAMDSLVTILQLGGLLLLAWAGELTVFRAFLIVGAAAGSVSLAWLFTNMGSIEFAGDHIRPDIRKNLSFGKWPLMSGTIWVLTMYLYPWLLAAFDGTAAAAVWAVGLGVMALGNPILLGLQNYVAPRIATDYATDGLEGIRRSVRNGVLVFGALMAPLTLFVIVFGGRIATAIYGDTYAGNGALVALLSVNLFISAIGISYWRGLFALEQADVDFRANVAGFVIMLTAGVWLTYTFGPVGAAWGLILSNIVGTLLKAKAFYVAVDPSYA